LLINDFFFPVVIIETSLHLCHHKLITQILDYRSILGKQLVSLRLKFADGTLYRANILKLDDLVSSSIAQASKVCSAQ